MVYKCFANNYYLAIQGSTNVLPHLSMCYTVANCKKSTPLVCSIWFTICLSVKKIIIRTKEIWQTFSTKCLSINAVSFVTTLFIVIYCLVETERVNYYDKYSFSLNSMLFSFNILWILFFITFQFERKFTSSHVARIWVCIDYKYTHTHTYIYIYLNTCTHIYIYIFIYI